MLSAIMLLGTVGAAAQDSDFDIELDGRKTWKLKYGFGNPVGLALASVAPGRISLDQTLSVDIVGEALSVLSLEIHYNDQQPESLQSMALYLDTERLDGVAGDFTLAGASDFTTYNKKMRGLRLDYEFGDSTLTAVASRSESVSQSRVFVGQTAASELAFSRFASEGSTLPAPYRSNLDGLYAFPLVSLYAEAFSTVSFELPASARVRAVLAQYDLGYLNDTLTSGTAKMLKEQEYRVIEDSGQVLLLRRDAVSMLREHVRDAITQYNADSNLAGDDAQRYPFASGTDYELAFLDLLLADAELHVDEDVYSLNESVRQRYYDLGHAEVEAKSVSVEVSATGTVFDTVGSPRLPGYSVEVLAEDGILICSFPAAFFEHGSMIRVAFSYAVSGGSFSLGLSLVPESERVLLNNELLVRDVDYLIEYDVGMLFLLVDIEDTDVLQVDYELFSGGFGQVADYSSYFFGLILEMPISEEISVHAQLLQLAEDPNSASDPETVATMPNRHTIAGVSADIELAGFSADVLVGYNQDRFPYDDNARMQKPNAIATIAANDEIVVYGHLAGITVNQLGDWATYSTANGLASRVVHDVLLYDNHAMIATAAGLNIVELDGAAPFDRLANWARFGNEDGLGDDAATALAVSDDVLWIGTETALVSVPLNELEDPEQYVRYGGEGFDGLARITALAVERGAILVGTDHGAYLYDPATESVTALDGMEGAEVTDIVLANETAYFATSRGVRGYRGGIGTGWLVLGEPVYALAVDEGRLLLGVEDGLRAAGTGEMLIMAGPVTALASDGFGVWVGMEAHAGSDFDAYYIDEYVNTFPIALTGFPEVNPGGFVDTDPDEHTAQGWVGRASFHSDGGIFSLSGTVESYPPTFRTIGSASRSDRSGWSLGGTYRLSEHANLDASHSYRIDDLAEGDPSTSLYNRLAFRWTSGMSGTFEVRHEAETLGADQRDERTGELSYNLSLRDQFLNDALGLTLLWMDSTSHSSLWDDDITQNRLAVRSTVRLTDALSASAGWRRPVRWIGSDLSGSERIDWSVDWARTFDWIGFSADYASDWSRDLSDERGHWEHAASLSADLEKIEFDTWALTPDAEFSWENTRSAHDLDGELKLRADIGDLMLRSSLEGGLRDLGMPVVHQNGELSFSVRYNGIESLSVNASYSGNVDAAVKGQARKTTLGHALTGRVVWDPENGKRDELTYSLRTTASDGTLTSLTAILENEFRMSLDDLFSAGIAPDEQDSSRALETAESEERTDGDDAAQYPLADLRVDSKAEYRLQSAEPDAAVSTTGHLSVQLSSMWSVNVSAMGAIGYRPSTALYASGLIEVEVAIDF